MIFALRVLARVLGETQHDHSPEQLLGITPLPEPVATRITPYQRVDILTSLEHGTVLAIDGLIQSSEFDEHVYHELMVHPALAAHPMPRSVLIMGGGEGATAREVLKHPTVESVTMVDIDGELVEFVRKFWPELADGAFDDPRFNLVISDCREYLASTDATFDVIIIDLTAPTADGPAEKAYTAEAFALSRSHLAPHGIIAAWGNNADLERCEGHVVMLRTAGEVFGHVAGCYASIPVFGGVYGFVLASDDPINRDAKAVADILRQRGVPELRHLDEETLRSTFSTPRHVRDKLAQSDSVATSTDARPHVVATYGRPER